MPIAPEKELRWKVAASLVLGAVAVGALILVALRLSSSNRIAQGALIYTENCASCHGANLEGQSNWMQPLPTGRLPAPPHDESGHTWHHSDDDLFKITKFGLAAIVPGYESDMPTYASVLTDAEILSVLEFIKSRWPERERAYQADRTRNVTK